MNTDKHGFNRRKRREKTGEGRIMGARNCRYEISKMKNMHSLQNCYAQ
jgi:hypothetical protein